MTAGIRLRFGEVIEGRCTKRWCKNEGDMSSGSRDMSEVCTAAQLGQVGAQLELWWNGWTESPETWDIGSSQWH